MLRIVNDEEIKLTKPIFSFPLASHLKSFSILSFTILWGNLIQFTRFTLISHTVQFFLSLLHSNEISVKLREALKTIHRKLNRAILSEQRSVRNWKEPTLQATFFGWFFLSTFRFYFFKTIVKHNNSSCSTRVKEKPRKKPNSNVFVSLFNAFFYYDLLFFVTHQKAQQVCVYTFHASSFRYKDKFQLSFSMFCRFVETANGFLST